MNFKKKLATFQLTKLVENIIKSKRKNINKSI